MSQLFQKPPKPKAPAFGTPVQVNGTVGWPGEGGEELEWEPGVFLALRKQAAPGESVRRTWVYYVGFRSGASRWVLPEFVTTTEEKP